MTLKVTMAVIGTVGCAMMRRGIIWSTHQADIGQQMLANGTLEVVGRDMSGGGQ